MEKDTFVDHPILSNVSQFFFDDLNFALKNLIKDETIDFAANIANFGYDNEIWFGYLLITSKRLIRTLFKAEVNLGGIGSFIGLILAPATLGLTMPRKKPFRSHTEVSSEIPPDNLGDMGRLIVDIPISPLSSSEKDTRKVVEYPLHNIAGIERRQYKTQEGKYPMLYGLSPVFLPDKKVNLVFYSDDDATKVYEFLTAFMRTHSYQISPTQIADQLEKLSELHRYQVITDEEYENAKKRLLNGGT